MSDGEQVIFALARIAEARNGLVFILAQEGLLSPREYLVTIGLVVPYREFIFRTELMYQLAQPPVVGRVVIYGNSKTRYILFERSSDNIISTFLILSRLSKSSPEKYLKNLSEITL